MRRCDGVDRREFLRLGSLGTLGLGLSEVLRLRAHAGENPPGLKNCILIWLDGGPSHLETFDLKPDAPAEVRGPYRPIATNVPGLMIGEHFGHLARQADKVCLIRSMTSELGEHNFGRHYLLTGYKPSPVLEYPSYGAVVARCRGPQPALPSYVAVPDATPQGGPGYLPSAFGPFTVGGDPSKPDFRVRDLETPGRLAGRLDRRRRFMADFDRFDRRVEQEAARGGRDNHFEQAYRLMTSPAAKGAFDLSREPHAMRERYGMHRVGQSCLLARRLVEAGCPFVTVTDAGWDTHQQIDRELREGYVGGHAGLIPKLDQALATLLADLDERGLLAGTLVLAMGEFGRTPKLNTAGGRDHWPRAFSVCMAGGGVQGGQVVGRTDASGESPADRPASPADLAQTVYTLLGIDPDREFHTDDGRPVKVAAGGATISECLT
ncbi:DUF1501 domain-containing protein [Singulisphaera sp. Ch08]|uniref:DUF1501 domain-containing protein n=1 Tax=Singulisphaera sp. Ch08 TaxID=3120278 RepID=A0AAU7CQL9_9BACT